MSKNPPGWMDRLLDLVIKERLLEEIKGDLHEYYAHLIRSDKKLKNVNYLYHITQFFRPFALKIPFKNSIIRTMIRLNWMVAWRNMQRNKFFSFINILGLSLGLAVCLLIGIFIKDELSYDKHWKNSNRIYRVVADLNFDGNVHHLATSPGPMAEAYKSEFPEIEKGARMRNVGKQVLTVGDRNYPVVQFAYADQEILDIFQLDLIDGSFKDALAEPNSVIISETTSKKVFGSNQSVGNSFEISDQTLVVKAVYEDIPNNTHFHYNGIISMELDNSMNKKIWLSNNYRTYFLLNENNNWQSLQAKFETTYKKYFGPQLMQLANVSWDEFEESDSKINYYLQPLESIHLHSNLGYEIENNGNIQYIWILTVAGLFVLVIASINFMNIATAQSSLRAKEVGMKKVLGSHRRLLISQFITESILYALFAMVAAIGITYILLPYLNDLAGKNITNPLFGDLMLWDDLLIISIAIGLLAGAYPAFFLSSYKPLNVLKGKLSLGMRGKGLRNVMVVTQFIASVLLVFGSYVIYSQLTFFQNKSLGFNKSQVLILEDTYTLGEKVNSFREELVKHSGIENATVSSYLPVEDGSRSDSPLQPKGYTTAENSISFQLWRADENYVPTLQLELVKGRNFSENLAIDSAGILINETGAKRLGWEDPIGKKLQPMGTFDVYGMKEFTVIGVFKDFHFEDFTTNITPLALFYVPSTSKIAIRFNAESLDEVLNFVDAKWNEFNPGYPLQYGFLDQKFEAHYHSEEKLGKLFSAFAIFSVIIACLGLIGLASFTMDQRKKELGVRKVLGATSIQLILSELSSFSKLLIIALIIGLTAGGFLMSRWLENFMYRTEIGFLSYALPIILIFLVSSAIVSFIAFNASRKNPVQNLHMD